MSEERSIMSADSNRTVIVRYVEEIWNQGRLDVIDEIIAPDYVNHSAAIPDAPPGPGGRKPIVAAMRRGFPDLHYTIEDMVLGDDKAAVRTTMRGTNTGELFGAAPTALRHF